MLAMGNGRPEICAANLLLIRRGEVPFSRVKGLSNRLIDLPAGQYAEELNADVTRILEIFEPRVDAERKEV